MLKGVAATVGVGLTAGALFTVSNSFRDCDLATYRSHLDPTYFQNRIIWITGASSGIGRALAILLYNLNVGVKLVLSARRKNILQDLKANSLSSSKDVFVLPLDLSENDPNYYRIKYESILKEFQVSHIDILINNAGFSMRSYFTDLPLKVSLEMIQTNLVSPIILSKLVLDAIINSDVRANDKFGHIINVSSVVARLVPPTRSTYAVTKCGLSALTQPLNAELEEYPNISVTDVMPGPVATDVDLSAFGRNGEKHNKRDIGLQNGMTAMRCAELICIASCNRIGETWPVQGPALNLMYASYYLPALYQRYGLPVVSKGLRDAAGYFPSKL